MNNGSHNLSGEAAFKKIGCGFCFELLYFSLADVVVAAVAVAVVVAVMQWFGFFFSLKLVDNFPSIEGSLIYFGNVFGSAA